ncbi:MAG: ABC transporter ATP-binding protein [Amphritea sp.]|nr:ABC transporter ATP-binding protein [Amphritea sp.]
MRLTVSRLHAQRSGKSVLRDISLSFDKPELIGLIGPNGAGKSTLMRALSGLQSYSGSIQLDGTDLAQYAPQALARQLAFLPQERTVHWALDCEEVVMLGRMPYQSGFGRASVGDHRIVERAMQTMDVLEFSRRSFEQLSGGEQARVLIARVLAQEPDMIIADEPINGLDPAHQISLMKTFRELVAAGRTVLTSLHDLSLASHWCDRIIILEHGDLIADGAVDQVMTPQQIRKVYGVETMAVSTSGRTLIVPTDLAE